MNHCLTQLRNCDVILKNGSDEFLGLCYNPEFCDAPVILLKGNWNFDYCLTKLAERMGILCVEKKILVRLLYLNFEEKEPIPEKYWEEIARIYSRLEKFSKSTDEAGDPSKLNKDVVSQICSLEEEISRKAINKCEEKNICNGIHRGNVVEYFSMELQELVEQYELQINTLYNPAFKTYEFYLSSNKEKFNIDIWQLIIISKAEQKILIGTRTLFKQYDYMDSESALAFIKDLVIAYNIELKRNTETFSEEIEISPRFRDIIQSSITAMLELNYNENNFEYGYDFDNLYYVEIYLRKSHKDKMYEIHFTYKEFIRYSDIVRAFLRKPTKMYKKNFWCKERKYNKKYFSLKH